jgi:hypothetical protein
MPLAVVALYGEGLALIVSNLSGSFMISGGRTPTREPVGQPDEEAVDEALAFTT